MYFWQKVNYFSKVKLGIGLLGGPLHIINRYSTEIGYLKRVIKKLFYFGVQTLGGRGGGSRKVWTESILSFFVFNDDLPNLYIKSYPAFSSLPCSHCPSRSMCTL